MSNKELAGWAWVLGIVLIPAQVVVALQWPELYSWRSNLISDLGSTMCGVADEASRVERYVCSPWYVLANAATIVNGLLLAIGAALLWFSWPRPAAGRTASALLILAGLMVVGVGLVPWDANADLHNLFALVQAPLQWVAMGLIVIVTWRSEFPRIVPWATLAGLVLSVAGFVLFIDAVGGGASADIGLGAVERLAFDTLVVWSAVVGLALIVRERRAPAAETSAGLLAAGRPLGD
jgi:hypothetical membrane protein